MYKKIIKCGGIFLTGLILMNNAYSVNEGFFLGAMVGKTNTHNPSLTLQTTTPGVNTTATANSNGYGARLFMGYNFNPYAAWESGLTYYSPPSYSANPPPKCSPEPSQASFDLFVKGIAAIPQIGLNAFGKGGLAYVYRQTSCNVKGQKAVRPAFGIGLGYDITQKWVVDLSFTRILQGGGIQNTDFIALGISYHFVNEYCGQFLC